MQVPDNCSGNFSEWLKYMFEMSTGTCSPRQKAEAYRAYIAKIQYAWANSEISEASAINLFKTYAEKCSAIIDSDKMESSLNNYAESILSQAKYQQNDSDKWQSSLTTNNILELKNVQDMIDSAVNVQKSLLTSADSSVKLGNWVSSLGALQLSGPADLQAALFKCPEGNANIVKDTKLSVLMKEDKDYSSSISAISVQTRKDFITTPLFGNHTTNVSPLGPEMLNSKISVGCSNYGKRKEFYSSGDEVLETQHLNKKQSMNRHKEVAGSSTDGGGFKTAKEKLWVDEQKKHNQSLGTTGSSAYCVKRCLGTARSRGLHGKFVPPVPKDSGDEYQTLQSKTYGSSNRELNIPSDERLKNIEPKMIDLIMSEIMDHGPAVSWDDIAGLDFAKNTIKEIVVWPMLRPDIFTGLRGPPKGILLFGPPGTGKTLIGKCIASQSGATFFSISASSLTSKWVGEGEKMVRSLFTVARCHQPAVIFIDEIDSLLSQRGEGEHESSRRIKTEFLVQLDGATTSSEEHILVVGATNRPQEIDEAARRRLAKRLYIPLPESSARKQIVVNLMSQEKNRLTDQEVCDIVLKADGFSGADMTQLCREAALGPIRSIQATDISTITPDQVLPIAYVDFQNAFQTVRPSVSQKDLELYETWNKTFGCGK